MGLYNGHQISDALKESINEDASGEYMNKKVFVVEDDQDIREALAELLESEGYDVTTAENGQIGIDKLSQASQLPNLILLDLMMPVKDGFQFYAEKAADPNLSSVPVIVMSADGHILDKQKKLQAQAYIKKPVDIDHILNMVDQFCQ